MKSKRLARSTDRARQSIIRSVDKTRPAMVEVLEERQMLSLTIDLQVVGSSNPKMATVSSVGQVVTIDEFATITGTTSGTNDELWEIDGSLLSSKTASGAVNGNLSNTINYPFNTGLSWFNGTAQDLNGDGNLDVGSNDNADAMGFVVARAGGPVGSNYGTVSGDSATWLVSTLTYTVTKLNVGESTDVNWRWRDGLDAGAYDAIWVEDGDSLNDATGTIGLGAPVVISDPSLIPPPTGSLSGAVSKSVNGTTSAFAGVTMYLDLNDSGTLTSSDPTSVTNSSGDYSFPNLADGTYYLREVVPSGYKQISPSTSPTLITLTGTDALTQNFTDTAATVTNNASIAGTVYKAATGASTVGFSGVTVYLDLGDKGTFESGDPSTTTSSSGAFSFTGLAAGTYDVRQEVPSGYNQTSPSSSPTQITLSAGQSSTGDNFTDTAKVAANTASIAGTVDKSATGESTSGFSGVTVYLDLSDAGVFKTGDPSTTTSSSGAFSFTGLAAGTYYLREEVPTGYSQTSPSTSPTKITLTAGQASSSDNFTDIATGSIAGTVFKAGTSTTGFSGVTVYLDLSDSGTFASSDPSTTTSSTGTFSFGNLAAGTYYLREEVPSGYKQTAPSTSPTTITLTAGQASTGDNFTDTAATTTNNASIAGTVYKAASGTSTVGFSGVTVYLDLSDSGAFKSGDPSTTTSSSGSFSFTGLAAGTYYLREEVPTGYTQTSPSTTPTKITLGAGQSSTGDNFTDTAVSYIPGSISGTVYVDKTGSGKLATGDTGIGNIEMYLDLNNDNKIDAGDPIVTTNSSGAFTFTGLAPGVYRLREVVLNGYMVTNTSVGYFEVTIKSNYQITGENFLDKIVTPNGVILSGNVFDDANDNGVRDAGETGLSGWVVYLDLNDSGKFETIDNNKTTDSNGNFSFVSLNPGTYYVRVIPVSGYSETIPSSGFYKVTLVAGTPGTIEFGEHQTGATTSTGGGTVTNGQTLSGNVFEDLTGSGVQTSSDPGLGGWVVYCDLNDSGTFQSDDNNKTTTSNGDFSFVSLKPGTYIIRVIPESGYQETDPASGFYTVTLSAGGTVTGIDFGEEKT